MQEINNPWLRRGLEPVNADTQIEENPKTPESSFIQFWGHLRRFGLGDHALRIATITTTILLALLIVWVMNTFYLKDPQQTNDTANIANAQALPEPTATLLPPPPFHAGGSNPPGIAKEANLHTVLRVINTRYEITEYTVETGDSIFSIAEKFNLKPESILWGNRYTLGEDPHLIVPGQTLNIMPIDGVLHKWSAGEGLNGVASHYKVSPEDIINWPGNDLNPEEVGDYANPNIPTDKMLMIPNGQGTFTDWRAPRISRNEPASAKHLGPGACSTSYDGVTGTLTFLWPSTERYLSGFDYSPETNHFGIDVAGSLGNPIYAADHGVVVYAGWSDYGYGEMIVIDHGSGWQTLYAHLSVVSVGCGQEVYKGDPIGSMGSTGRSTGPHLHFEMRSETYGRVNPWDFLN